MFILHYITGGDSSIVQTSNKNSLVFFFHRKLDQHSCYGEALNTSTILAAPVWRRCKTSLADWSEISVGNVSKAAVLGENEHNRVAPKVTTK